MNSYITKYNIEENIKYMTIVLVFCTALLSFLYIYFINSSVLNAVAREQSNKEIASLVIKISGLENSYMAIKSELSIDKAHSLGFQDDYSKVHFSSESPNVAGNLSLRGNEI